MAGQQCLRTADSTETTPATSSHCSESIYMPMPSGTPALLPTYTQLARGGVAQCLLTLPQPSEMTTGADTLMRAKEKHPQSQFSLWRSSETGPGCSLPSVQHRHPLGGG